MAKKKAKATTNQFSALVLRALKQEVNQKATALIENVLKPRHVEPAPRGRRLNYLVDITTKWALPIFGPARPNNCPGWGIIVQPPGLSA